ncbi:hypothetical protein BSKO_00968 [Bryopsis sp. KO-2023]|nr:hypothetical protein BSKO_00968 [Bryopsis sp. KO-2023]
MSMAPLADASEDGWQIVNKLEEENYNLRVQAQKLQVALSKCGRQADRSDRGRHVPSSQSAVPNKPDQPCDRTEAEVAKLVEEKLNIALEGIGELAVCIVSDFWFPCIYQTAIMTPAMCRERSTKRKSTSMVCTNGCSLRSQSPDMPKSGQTGEIRETLKEDAIDPSKKPTEIGSEPTTGECGNEGEDGDLWTASFLNDSMVAERPMTSNVGASKQEILRAEPQKAEASAEEAPVVLKKSEVDFIWREIQELREKVKNAETEMSRQQKSNGGAQDIEPRPTLSVRVRSNLCLP